MTSINPKRGLKKAFSNLAKHASNRLFKGAQPKQTQRKPRQQKVNKPRHERTKGLTINAEAPTNISVTRRNTGPTSGRSNLFRVSHREYVKDVMSAVNFTATSVNINPGLPTFTSWLSNIAPWYELYTVHSMEFEYVPMTSTASSGRMIYSVDYDAEDAIPTTLVACENTGDSTSSSIWAPFKLRCQPRNLKSMVKQRYVRRAGVNGDLKTYDIGKFIVGVDGCANGTTKIGQVYVRYDITFSIPQLGVSGYNPGYLANWGTRALTVSQGTLGTGTTYYPFEAGVIANMMYGDDSLITDSGLAYPLVVHGSRTTMVLPAGEYLYTVATTNSAVTGTISGTGSTTFNAGGVGITNAFDYNVNVTDPGFNTTRENKIFHITVSAASVAAGTNYFYLSAVAAATSGTSAVTHYHNFTPLPYNYAPTFLKNSKNNLVQRMAALERKYDIESKEAKENDLIDEVKLLRLAKLEALFDKYGDCEIKTNNSELNERQFTTTSSGVKHYNSPDPEYVLVKKDATFNKSPGCMTG